MIRCLGLGLGLLAVPFEILLRLELLLGLGFLLGLGLLLELGLGFGRLLGPYFVG